MFGSPSRRVIAAALGVAGAFACRSAPDPRGEWLGQVAGTGSPDRLELVIDSSIAGATVTLLGRGLRSAAGTVMAIGDSVVILVGAERDTVRLAGRVAGDRLLGMVRSGADSTPFVADRLASLTTTDLRALAGSYRTDRSALIGIGTFAELGTRPFLIDYASGRLAPLYPISRDRFLAGKAVIAPVYPADTVTVTRGADGSVESVRFLPAGFAPLMARRVATRDEDVTFTNGSVSLGATLTLPAGPPPHPAIVLVHGSNAQPRETFGPWQRFFAGQGFAVLAYDKRGTGSSTGDWKEADFAMLAADALAGVRFLAGRSEIRKDRIGLWGISQGGWILPMVAAEAPGEVAFLVVHAGTGTTVREQGTLNLRQELRASGLPDSAVAVGVRYRELDDRVTETGKGLGAVERFYQTEKAAHPWLWPPSPLDAWFRGYYRTLIGFDPDRYWKKVTCPVLLFFGEVDVNVPPEESWPPIERATAGNHRVTHFVLPRANHVLLEAKTGGGDEYPHLSRFVAGYFDRMAEWLTAVAR